MPPTLAEAVEFATVRLDQHGKSPVAGKMLCPLKRQYMLSKPAYPVWAQIHQNRLASMLTRPSVLQSLHMICVLASAVERRPDGSVQYSQRVVPDALLTGGPCVSDVGRSCSFPLPQVLGALRSKARSTRIVLYHNPRGSAPTGTDSCVSLAEAETRRGMARSFSWHEAGTVVRVLNASSASVARWHSGGEGTITLLVAPPFDMATRAPRRECLLVPTRPGACSGASHYQGTGPGAASGWRTVVYRSFARIGDHDGGEAVEVLRVRQRPIERGVHCEVTVKRHAGRQAAGAGVGAGVGVGVGVGFSAGSRLAPGLRIYAPTLLDAGASAASCRTPAQHAFDYSSQLAADCIQTYLARDLALGADGSWLDNMGANLYGARSPRGSLLNSYHLYLGANTSQCEGSRRRAARSGATYEEALAFRDCAFSIVASQQRDRLQQAVRAAAAAAGHRPKVFANGLKHSFYWSATDMSRVRQALQAHRQRLHHAAKGVGSGLLHPLPATTPSSGPVVRDESPPFSSDPAERVLFFAVNSGATQALMAAEPRAKTPKPALLDGFNMESFYGFIESKSESSCNRWPTDNWTSLRSCGFTFHTPGSAFWHANVRVMAHAAQHELFAMAKVGQAGWKSYAQELLPPKQLHRWWLGAYATFLLAVARPNGTISLGIHPYARTPDGRTVPWLHPALWMDLGAPLNTHMLLEEYQPAGHTSYVRAFERGVAVYNPHDRYTDRSVPLGTNGLYVDPWDAEQTGGCGGVASVTLAPHEGRVLVRSWLVDAAAAVTANVHTAANAHGMGQAAAAGEGKRRERAAGSRRLFAKSRRRERPRAWRSQPR